MRLLLIFLLLVTVAAPLRAAPPNAPTVARDEFHVTITPKMKRYAQTNYVLYFAGTAYAILLYWGILASGLSAKMRDFALRGAKMAWMALPYLLLTARFVIDGSEFAAHLLQWLLPAARLRSIPSIITRLAEGCGAGTASQCRYCHCRVLGAVRLNTPLPPKVGIVGVGPRVTDHCVRHLRRTDSHRPTI